MSERTFTNWELRYHGWARKEQPLREALMTLGNGHFATRGAGEEAVAGGDHYPGTYLAGGYDRAQSEVAGRIVENEDLVNWPNWLPLSFRCGEGDWVDLDTTEVMEYELRLNLFAGVLERRVRFRDRAEREFILESRRIVHMEMPHIAAIQWVLSPQNWSGRIEIRSGIDGRVTNGGVARYRKLESQHLDILDRGATGEDAVFLMARAKQSRVVVVEAVRTQIDFTQAVCSIERRNEFNPRSAAQHLDVVCEAKKPIRVEKVLAIASSRDFATSEPCVEACKRVHRAPGFDVLLKRHCLAWRRLWHRADLDLQGVEEYSQLVLRLHIFHILQTASMNTIGRDVGIPARGLHGEAYRGHIFWDELFTFPFLNLRIPELTRALLMYRYRRLDEARHAAGVAGYQGAMFPWQSGSDGREESQTIHLNPRSGRWLPDFTHRQRHVNAAIAFNVWQYFQATHDVEFLSFYGAEMLLEIARFWASLCSYNPDRRRYEIHGVVGPDEFHTRYPGSSEPGISNNAYTNVMAAWVLSTVREALEAIADDRRTELLQILGIAPEDLIRWDDISRRMYVPFHGGGLMSQFEGWEELEELDWEGLKRRHGNIQRLDRILEAEGDDPNRYKATKQADALMLFYLFSADELGELFGRLGYPMDRDMIPRNVRYYLARTSHGSTLSRVVHAWVLARASRGRSWYLFRNALASDIEDVQGGTTAEGVHLGAMAGTVDLIQRCYSGVETRRGVLWLNPALPDQVEGLRFSVRYRGHWLALRITQQSLTVRFEKGRAGPACVGFRGEVHSMKQGEEISFSLDRGA